MSQIETSYIAMVGKGIVRSHINTIENEISELEERCKEMAQRKHKVRKYKREGRKAGDKVLTSTCINY